MREPEYRDAVCTCGHPWGEHYGDAPHLCAYRKAGHGCVCSGFTPIPGLDTWDDEAGMTQLQKMMFR